MLIENAKFFEINEEIKIEDIGLMVNLQVFSFPQSQLLRKTCSKVSIDSTSMMFFTIVTISQVTRITTLLYHFGATQMRMVFWIKFSIHAGTNSYTSISQPSETITRMSTFWSNLEYSSKS